MALPNGNAGATNGTTQYVSATYYKTAAQSTALVPVRQWLQFDDEVDTWGYYNYPGSPEGNVAANIGSWCSDTTNGVLYVKTTDTANTGWVSFAGGIHTINGDSGSITGSTVTIFSNNASNNAGASVRFVNSGTISTLNVSDTSHNTFIGNSAGNLTTTSSNSTCLGYLAGRFLTSGGANTYIGRSAGANCTTGTSNTIIGQSAGGGVSTGGVNTIVGANACDNITTGQGNLALGYQSGTNLTGSDSSNIILSNTGTSGDNNKIIIGTQGSGTGQQNTCYIAGIVGVTVSNQQAVTINSSTGQLGISTAPFGTIWSVITNDQTAVVGNGYICNKGSALVLTLPASAAIGDIIEVTGINTALGWKIAQNANQQIFFGNQSTTLGATGYLQSSAIRDSIKLVCVVSGASTVYNVISSVGNITVN